MMRVLLFLMDLKSFKGRYRFCKGASTGKFFGANKASRPSDVNYDSKESDLSRSQEGRISEVMHL